MKRLLLLGGGVAHLHVLKALARTPLPAAEVMMVSPFERSIYSGMVPGLVAGRYRRPACEVAVKALADAARVHFVAAQATALDAGRREVTLSDGRVAGYDVLSVDTGCVIDRDAIPGAREHALFVRPMEHFLTLLQRVLELSARRTLDIVVVGGGAAGVELALGLSRRLAVPGAERARVGLVAGAGGVLANYPPGVRERALAVLKRARVTVFRQRCIELNGTQAVLDGGARLACDVPVLALRGAPPPWLAGSGLALGEGGFIATTPTLQSASHPEVFAAGDVASPVAGTLPRSGVYAVRAGPPLAFNLRRHVAGGRLQAWRPQRRSLNLLACGDGRAIMSWGPLVAQGRWAGWWKDRIDRGFVAGMALAPA